MRALEFHCRTSIAINTKSSITIVQRTQKVLGWNAREIFRSKFVMFKSHLYNSMVGGPAVACHCNFGILEFSLLSILTVSQQLKHVFCSTIYQFDIQASKMRSTHFQIFLLISQKHSEFRKENTNLLDLLERKRKKTKQHQPTILLVHTSHSTVRADRQFNW